MTFFKELTTSSNYTTDPYGYGKNQLAHLSIGFIMATVVSALSVLFAGEFLYKGDLFAIMCVIFVLWEFVQRSLSVVKVTIWDSVEDWVFMALYGSGTAIFLFSESEVGSPWVTSNIYYSLPFVGVVATHLFVGILARIMNRKRDARKPVP